MLGSLAARCQYLLMGFTKNEETYNATTFDSQTCVILARVLQIRGFLTFGKLLDEMLGDGLELSGINSEQLLQPLDLLHKVLWHIGHGACNRMLAKI
jgi:hypothetical protein